MSETMWLGIRQFRRTPSVNMAYLKMVQVYIPLHVSWKKKAGIMPIKSDETKAFDRDKLKSVSIKMLLIPLIAKTNRRFSSLCRP